MSRLHPWDAAPDTGPKEAILQGTLDGFGSPSGKYGGARRVRTADPRLAKPVLSRLSYGPTVVGLGGLEPPTSPLSGVRSNHLSYRPARGLPQGVGGRLANQANHSLKEVIQPQVPLRLPCYDFIPITNHTLGTYLPCGLNQPLRVQSAFVM